MTSYWVFSFVVTTSALMGLYPEHLRMIGRPRQPGDYLLACMLLAALTGVVLWPFACLACFIALVRR